MFHFQRAGFAILGTLAVLVGAPAACRRDDRNGGRNHQETVAVSIEELIHRLSSPDPRERFQAAYELADRGSEAEPALTVLAESLSDPVREVRIAAAGALGAMGPIAQPAVAALDEALNDPVGDVRVSAAVALGRIGPGAEPAVDSLIRRLGDMEEAERYAVIDALGAIGPKASDAISNLTSALSHDDEEVRRRAAMAIGRIDGVPAAAAVPRLIDLLDSRGGGTRCAAAFALERIGRRARPAVPRLAAGLEDPERSVRAAVAAAIAEITEMQFAGGDYALVSKTVPLELQATVEARVWWRKHGRFMNWKVGRTQPAESE